MKAFKSIRLLTLNLAVYGFLTFLSIIALGYIWRLADRIFFHPIELNHSYIQIIKPSNNSFILLKEEVFKEDNHMYLTLKQNELIYDTIKRVVSIIILFLITLQLRKLLKALQDRTYFIKENLFCVKKISYLLVIWVILDFVLYQSFQLFIPMEYIQQNYNYSPLNRSIIYSLLLSIDYLKLMAAFAFYLISIFLIEGYPLKEQSDLTI